MMDTDFTSLIDVQALRALMGSAAPPRVVDVRFDLADTSLGRSQHAAGHIPGAHYLHLDEDLSGARQVGEEFRGRHPLPDRDAFAARMRALGLRRDQQVVAYDGADGMYAARLWWMLRWLGHERVAVLNGGWAAWQAAGGPVGTDTPATAPGDFTAGEALEAPWTKADVLAQLGRVRLVDARAGERFRGEVEPLDRQAGHIPGASNRFFKTNLDGNGRFRAPAALRAEFELLLGAHAPGQTVHQCGSGVTACHNLLAMHHAGLRGSRLYVGSWSEWSADPHLPLAKG